MATPEFIPDNPNLFQLEALSGNPNLSAISVRCPHCRELSLALSVLLETLQSLFKNQEATVLTG